MKRLDDLRRIADRVQTAGLQATARELRAIADVNDVALGDDRPCPIQDLRGGLVRSIPWALADRLYPAYGHGQSLEELAARGGFGRMELGMLAVGNFGGGDQLRRGQYATSFPLLDLWFEAERARAALAGAEGGHG